jgi:hypothetical protein
MLEPAFYVFFSDLIQGILNTLFEVIYGAGGDAPQEIFKF